MSSVVVDRRLAFVLGRALLVVEEEDFLWGALIDEEV